MPRTLIWFSAGAASAVAAYLTLQRNPKALVLYCDTGSEHPDNQRFVDLIGQSFGQTGNLDELRCCALLNAHAKLHNPVFHLRELHRGELVDVNTTLLDALVDGPLGALPEGLVGLER